MKSRALLITLTVVAAVASLALIAGCGSKPTLEQYFQNHEDEWAEVQDQVKNLAGEMFEIDMTVKDNQISQVMTYTETFGEEQLAAMKDYFEQQKAAIQEQVAGSIALIQQQTDAEGVTWVMKYNNGDGAEIFSMTIDGASAPESGAAAGGAAPADTSTVSDTSSAA